MGSSSFNFPKKKSYCTQLLQMVHKMRRLKGSFLIWLKFLRQCFNCLVFSSLVVLLTYELRPSPMSACLSVSSSAYLSVRPSVFMFIRCVYYVCLSVRPSVCIYVHPSRLLRLSVCLSVCLSVRPSVRLSVCLFK
jgi:hypothetical protein